MKRKNQVLLVSLGAAMLLTGLTACGSGESEPAAVEEQQTASVSSSSEEEDTAIVRENFQNGVLVEGGEDEVSFEITRMELAEEGFVIEYAASLPSHGHRSYGELNTLMVNGCKLTPTYYDSENKERSDLAGSTRAVVDRATMDRLNITEVKSVKFNLEAGYEAYSSITTTDKWEVALYPGARDDSAFVYTPTADAQMLLDKDTYKVALADVEWVENKYGVCGQRLYFYCEGSEEDNSRRIDLQKLTIGGEEVSVGYREYYIWTDTTPRIIEGYWTFENKETSIKDLDLTKAELTLRIGENKGEEYTEIVKVPLDLSYPNASVYQP